MTADQIGGVFLVSCLFSFAFMILGLHARRSAREGDTVFPRGSSTVLFVLVLVILGGMAWLSASYRPDSLLLHVALLVGIDVVSIPASGLIAAMDELAWD